MNDLKPCPKCGGKASIEYENYDYDGGDWWLIRSADVVCQECGLVFHAENESREYQHEKHCLDFIIGAWNTRAERTCHIEHPFYGDAPVINGQPRCSECKTDFAVGAFPNYCPVCGAKVVSE